MLGTIINAAAVVVGASIGMLLKRVIPARAGEGVVKALSLCVIVMGIQMALKSENLLIPLICVAIGTAVGEAINIEKRLDTFGAFLQRKLVRNSSDDSFSKGFVFCSLLLCVGAMAIMGPIEAVLNGNNDVLYFKALTDGVACIAFGAAMGAGVIASGFSVLIYQGLITLLAQFVAPLLTTAMITEIGAVGGVLIIGIGLKLVGIKEIRPGNMLLAVFLPIGIAPLFELIL